MHAHTCTLFIHTLTHIHTCMHIHVHCLYTHSLTYTHACTYMYTVYTHVHSSHTSHRKKRMRQLQKKLKSGTLDLEKSDPFALFVAATNIRYCYYTETHKILGNTFGMCVLQVHVHVYIMSHGSNAYGI